MAANMAAILVMAAGLTPSQIGYLGRPGSPRLVLSLRDILGIRRLRGTPPSPDRRHGLWQRRWRAWHGAYGPVAVRRAHRWGRSGGWGAGDSRPSSTSTSGGGSALRRCTSSGCCASVYATAGPSGTSMRACWSTGETLPASPPRTTVSKSGCACLKACSRAISSAGTRPATPPGVAAESAGLRHNWPPPG